MKVKASAKAAVMAYRFLVAQYESWSTHFACRQSERGDAMEMIGRKSEIEALADDLFAS